VCDLPSLRVGHFLGWAYILFVQRSTDFLQVLVQYPAVIVAADEGCLRLRKLLKKLLREAPNHQDRHHPMTWLSCDLALLRGSVHSELFGLIVRFPRKEILVPNEKPCDYDANFVGCFGGSAG
jgi:hypothetical protein